MPEPTPPLAASDIVRQTQAPPPLRLVPPDTLDPTEARAFEAELRVEQVIDQVFEPDADYLRLPWETLARAIRGIKPGSLLVGTARSGTGKTTAALNLTSRLIAQGKRVFVITSEESPEDWTLLLACLAAHLDPTIFRCGERARAPDDTLSRLQPFLTDARRAEHLDIWPERKVALADLPHIFERASEFKADLVVLDHLNNLAVRDWRELGALVRGLRRLAERHRVTLWMNAQLKRRKTASAIERHFAPTTDDIEGGEVIAQVADLVLAFYWPLKSLKAAKDVKAGRMTLKEALAEHTVKVAVLKHRANGAAFGVEVALTYECGRLLDPSEVPPRLDALDRGDV